MLPRQPYLRTVETYETRSICTFQRCRPMTEGRVRWDWPTYSVIVRAAGISPGIVFASCSVLLQHLLYVLR